MEKGLLKYSSLQILKILLPKFYTRWRFRTKISLHFRRMDLGHLRSLHLPVRALSQGKETTRCR